MRALVLLLALSAPALIAQEHGAEKAGHAADEGEHHDSTTAWKIANFAILAGLMGFAISKAAGPFFRGRTEQIQKALVEARRLKEEAEQRAAGIDQRMANLGADIEAMKADARREMANEGERVQAETDRLLAKIRDHARQEIQSAEKQAIQELRAQAAELALGLAGDKIRARMTPQVQDSLVDQFVRRLDQTGGSAN